MNSGEGVPGEKRDDMATIRASCPDCGDIELTARDVTVRVCVEDNRGSYAFRCPDCRMAVTKPAEPRIVDLLVSSGVALKVWRLPAELSEPRSGAAITHDDLIELHELLQTADWFDRLSAMVEPT